MKIKTLLIILAGIALVGLLAYVFLTPTGTPPQPGPQKTTQKPGKTGTKPTGQVREDKQKPLISPEQRNNLGQIDKALQFWETNYKNRAEKIINPDLENSKLDDYLGDATPYDIYFSTGSVISLLGKYLRSLHGLRIEDIGDLAIQEALSSFYHRLKSEADPVSVSVVNASSKAIVYNERTIPAGGRLSLTSTNRKLGEAETGEGAFSFLGSAFPFNYQLPGQQNWDKDRFEWTKTGVSSYMLRVKK